MLGNVHEWCQDGKNAQKHKQKDLNSDIIKVLESVRERVPRLLRGGSYYDLPTSVRSAYRDWTAPSNLIPNVGFRPARTLR